MIWKLYKLYRTVELVLGHNVLFLYQGQWYTRFSVCAAVSGWSISNHFCSSSHLDTVETRSRTQIHPQCDAPRHSSLVSQPGSLGPLAPGLLSFWSAEIHQSCITVFSGGFLFHGTWTNWIYILCSLGMILYCLCISLIRTYVCCYPQAFKCKGLIVTNEDWLVYHWIILLLSFFIIIIIIIIIIVLYYYTSAKTISTLLSFEASSLLVQQNLL